MQPSIKIIYPSRLIRIDEGAEKITYVFLGITFLGLTYPHLGISEGGDETLKKKSTPAIF
jgi:hypothetical protein